MTPRAFVWATLTTFFALLAAVLSLNVAIDPFALAGTHLVPPAAENDRANQADPDRQAPRSPGSSSSEARVPERPSLPTSRA